MPHIFRLFWKQHHFPAHAEKDTHAHAHTRTRTHTHTHTCTHTHTHAHTRTHTHTHTHTSATHCTCTRMHQKQQATSHTRSPSLPCFRLHINVPMIQPHLVSNLKTSSSSTVTKRGTGYIVTPLNCITNECNFEKYFAILFFSPRRPFAQWQTNWLLMCTILYTKHSEY